MGVLRRDRGREGGGRGGRGGREEGKKESEVDMCKNASGTQGIDTPRGYRTPGVLRLGEVYREAVSRYTVITPP